MHLKFIISPKYQSGESNMGIISTGSKHNLALAAPRHNISTVKINNPNQRVIEGTENKS